MAKSRAAKMQIKNVNYPGKTTSTDAARCAAMKVVMLKVLPAASPGLTVAEVQSRAIGHLPESLFPAALRRAGG